MIHYTSTNPLERISELDTMLRTGRLSPARYGFELGRLCHAVGSRALWEIEQRLKGLEDDGR
jgi:hypothetical protein